jgi:hypothetical protein
LKEYDALLSEARSHRRTHGIADEGRQVLDPRCAIMDIPGRISKAGPLESLFAAIRTKGRADIAEKLE